MTQTAIEIPDPADPSKILRYRLRSLASASTGGDGGSGSSDEEEAAQIARWAAFCASCFSYKPNPPPASYFERHYWNDPGRDASLVKVVEFWNDNLPSSSGGGQQKEQQQDEEGRWEIASSLRVFRRVISDGSGGTLVAGGIGEVCTSEDHRRRSLSKMLLRDAIETMTHMGMDASLLHASPALQRVYERGGDYGAVRSRWSVVGVCLGRRDELRRYCVRVASFPSDSARLAALHRDFSESRFAGCIVRSDEYWTGYVSKELGDTLLVLTDAGEAEGVPVGSGSSSSSTIVAWLSVRDRGERYQLREFGADRARVGTGTALGLLLREAASCAEGRQFDLHLPTVVLDEINAERDGGDGTACSFVDWARGATSDDDVGWMYRPICGKGKDEEGAHIIITKFVDQTRRDEKRNEHLIWPTDSF